MKSRAPLYAGLAIVAILAGFLFGQFSGGSRTSQVPTLTHGTVLPSARALPAFTLLNQRNEPFTPQQLKGHWSIVFFGYTNCPDVCPTTLATLAQVSKQLASLPAEQQPQVVFVSVDPKRDTVSQLNSYVSFFNPAFVGVTGAQDQLDVLTRAMGVPVIINANGQGNYTVDHAATIYLLNPHAEMAAILSPPHQAQTLATDIQRVIGTQS